MKEFKTSIENISCMLLYYNSTPVTYLGRTIGVTIDADDGQLIAYSVLATAKVFEKKDHKRAKLWLIKEIITEGRRLERFFLRKIKE